jgi:hypothetical protein
LVGLMFEDFPNPLPLIFPQGKPFWSPLPFEREVYYRQLSTQFGSP